MAARDRGRGFAKAGALVAGQIRKAGESRGFAVSRVLTHWAEIVGPDLSALAFPVDVKYGREGGFGATLTVLAQGARAPLVEMRKEDIRARINAAYGYNAIARVRVTQTSAHGLAEDGPVFTPRPRAEPLPAAPAVEAARETAAGIQDTSLRAALEKLAVNVLSRRQDQERTPR